MYKSFNEHLEDDIDLRRLDSMASSNLAIKDKQYSMMCNIIRKAANFYSFVNEAKIGSLASRLQEKNIGAYELDKAIDKVIDNYDRFPSYKVIYELCVSYKKHGAIDDAITPEAQYTREEDAQIEKIEKNWNELMGADRLGTYVKWWLKVTYDLDPDMLNDMALSVELFKKPALYDWCDSGYSKDINKIAATAKNKLSKIQARISDPHNKQYKRV